MPYTPKVWVSHTSISDFLKCPKAYYLKNIYKDPKSNNKIQIITPPLSLGQAVHEVIESLASIKTENRFDIPLVKRFDDAWIKVSGKKGGFFNIEEENIYRKRGEKMLETVKNNPGPIKKPAVKINMELPNVPLTAEEDLILCGKIDWLEYVPEKASVNIIDFKTSQESKEDPDSLQLPIYHILVKNCQKYPVENAYYWYIEQSETPTLKMLPDYDLSYQRVLAIAMKIKLARQLESFTCPNGEEGCRECRAFQQIIDGKGEFVYEDKKNKKDVYTFKAFVENREGEIM
jgi:ATP-dependent helicase/DNAse subunit B